ncbi:CDP-alcohol phosphatidyltransferase [Vreelandella sulfidaeris]|uniref:CDP-alcohol phosphatidyltransferase n=1 Tax=Vreelandella sulfidaeris TaxID=115553 RepID=A0A365TNI2_9GAMM|nr:CDP-alcohol phosphatidyltransferase family protein [Halomonas sulfidaeris]RBI66414.1 CDP-alcohol phosphatidyltransferase [Halomonas sulfidaeris]
MPPFSDASLYTLTKRLYSAVELFIGGLLLMALGKSLPLLIADPANGWIAVGLYTCISFLVITFWPYGSLGWANRVTLLRAVLVSLMAGALAANAFVAAIWQWLALAVIALLLDGVDGWIARRTKSHTMFGARFDMELDALLILLLCAGLLRLESLGLWVLLIGGMRYLFVAAGWWVSWLSKPLFESFRRKAICVWQVVALLLALTPLTSHLMSSLLAISALLSLLYSFGFDVWWLYRQAKRT